LCNTPPPPELYTLSLHDALPICATAPAPPALASRDVGRARRGVGGLAPAAVRAHGDVAGVPRSGERRGGALPARDGPAVERVLARQRAPARRGAGGRRAAPRGERRPDVPRRHVT